MTINPLLALVDGVRQSWVQVKVVALGRLFTGITEVSYSETQIKENHYGQGNKVVMRGDGNITPKASIKLYSYEVNAILNAVKNLGGERLTDIDPFNIVVTYMPVGASAPVVHTLKGCQFTNNEVTVKQGDTKIEVPLELVLAEIKW